VAAGLPNITGMLGDAYGDSGAFYTLEGAFYGDHVNAMGRWHIDGVVQNNTFIGGNTHFDASCSNPIYGNSTTVTPLTYTVRAYIAYA